MAAISKQMQFLPFYNEKKILEESIKSFDEESLKRQVRLLFSRLNELEKRTLKQDEHINCLLDYILTE